MARNQLATPLLAFALLASCTETSGPVDVPSFRLTATITEDNRCTVNVMGRTYVSEFQVRGDLPAKFIGTLANESYHGFGCWVGTGDPAIDGDLVVLFAGNNLGKPLAPGTYSLGFDIFDNTPAGVSSVNFRPSELGGHRLRSKDGLPGTVTVEETPTGGRKITVDAEVVRWGAIF